MKATEIISLFIIIILNLGFISSVYAINPAYTSNTKTECEGSSCSTEVYSGIRYVQEDDIWKSIEEARSLKNTAIKCIAIKENEDDPDVECVDYNFTSVKLKITAKKEGKLAVKAYEREFDEEGTIKTKENKEKRKESEFVIGEIKELTYPLDYGEEIHIGDNSTIVRIYSNDSSTEYGCSYVDSYSATTQNDNTGASTALLIGLGGTSNTYHSFYCKFNTTKIPSSYVEYAFVSIQLASDTVETGEEINISAVHVFNNFTIDSGEWKEGNKNSADAGTNEMNYLERPTSSYMHSTPETIKKLGAAPSAIRHNWTITRAVSYEKNNSNNDLSIAFLQHSSTGLDAGTTDYYNFNSDQQTPTTIRPMLYVRYTVPVITQTPTPQNLKNLSQGPSSVYLNFTRFGTKYLLYRNGTNVANYTSKPINNTGLTSNTRYSFKIKIYNASNTISLSNFSNTIEVRTKQGCSIGISNVRNTTTESSIFLNYTAEGCYNYTWFSIYDGDWLVFEESNTYYTFTQLENNTDYPVQILAASDNYPEYALWNGTIRTSQTVQSGSSDSTLNLIYDQNGNLVSGDGKYRVYNSLNQLWKVYNGSSESGALLLEYTYHPVEERVYYKTRYFTGGNETTIYVSENFVRVVNSSGNFDYTYVFHEGQQVAQLKPNGVKEFIHGNHEGSSSVVTNSSGGVVERTDYTPFGTIVSGGSKTRFDYENKEFDTSLESFDFHFRQYKPEWGLFTQPDTQIPNKYEPQDLNRYSFENNNPYGKVDPDGHDAYEDAVIGGGFILAIAAGISKLPEILKVVEEALKARQIENLEKSIGDTADEARKAIENPTRENIDNFLKKAALTTYDVASGNTFKDMNSAFGEGMELVNPSIVDAIDITISPAENKQGSLGGTQSSIGANWVYNKDGSKSFTSRTTGVNKGTKTVTIGKDGKKSVSVRYDKPLLFPGKKKDTKN